MNSTEHVPENSWPLFARRRIEGAIHLLNEQQWIVQLMVRVFVGYFFMETGWGKLHNLDGFAQQPKESFCRFGVRDACGRGDRCRAWMERIAAFRRGARVRARSVVGPRAGDLLNATSPPRGPTTPGSPTSPTCPPGPGSSTSRWPSICTPGRSWAGRPPRPRTSRSSRTAWRWRCGAATKPAGRYGRG